MSLENLKTENIFVIEEGIKYTVLEYLKLLTEETEKIIEDINTLNEGKTDLTGDHKGTWQGYSPTETDPGIQAVVDQNVLDIAQLQTDVVDNTNLINNTYESLIEEEFLNAKLNGCIGDGVVDDTIALQDLLDLAVTNDGVSILIPNGTYLLTDTLHIYSNTHIIMSEKAILKRGASYNPMILNGDFGASYSAYDGQKNITISGGVIDGNGDVITTAFNHMSLGHSENITIENVTFLNGYDFHMIEMNGVRDSRIINCHFEHMIAQPTRQFTEMLQFDFMGGSGQFGSFGLYDNTSCDNIVVSNCTFKDGLRAIGSHTFNENVVIKNIKILNNYFYDFENLDNTGYAVQLGCWDQAIISNNIFELIGGITFKGSSNSIFSNNEIIDFRQHGIYLDDVLDSLTGLIAIPTKYNVLDNNKLSFKSITPSNNDEAIRLNKADDNIIKNNYIGGAGDNGIQLTTANNNKILNNVIENVDIENIAGRGIELSVGSNNNVVSDNVLSNDGTAPIGIEFTSTGTGNKAINNKIYGFSIPIDDTSISSVLYINSDENGGI